MAKDKVFSRNTFKVGPDIEIYCWAEGTRSGFRHMGELIVKGRYLVTKKVCYLNRTWESFQFESLLNTIAGCKEIKKDNVLVQTIENFINSYKEPNRLKPVATLMAMGNIFCQTIEERVSWKKRMVNTVPGFNFPDNFDSLPLEEQESRLDMVMNEMRKD